MLFLVSWVSFSQSIQDTVLLNTVNVKAQYLIKNQKAGSKATKVDSIVISNAFNESLSNLLHNHTSIFIKNEGRGALSSVSLRGTAPSHTQINWNGLQLNSPMTGMADLSLIPMYIIDDLQILHGSASIQNTGGALGGAMNLNSKPTWQKGFKYKSLTGFGSYDTYNNFFKLSYGKENLQVVTRFYYNSSDNDYEYLNKKNGTIDFETGEVTHHKVKNEKADYSLYGAMQEMYWKINERNILSYKFWHQQSDRSLPSVTSNESKQSSNWNNSRQTDDKFIVDWKRYGDNSELLVASFYSQQDLGYVYKNYVSGQGMTSTIDANNEYKVFNANAEYRYRGFKDLLIKAKTELNYDKVSSSEKVRKTGYDENRLNSSTLLALDYSVNQRLTTSVMMRYVWDEYESWHYLYYAGLNFQLLNGENLYLKANVTKNDRMPTLNDKFFLPGGNEGLLPEHGKGGEVGLEYFADKLCCELTYFKKNIDDYILWMYTGMGYWTPINLDKVKTSGCEVNLKYSDNIGKLQYRLSGNYSYTRSLNYGDIEKWGKESYGKQLIYVPLHNATLSVNLQYGKTQLYYNYSYYSERFTTSSNDINNRDWLYPYHMNDMTLSHYVNIGKLRCDLRLKVNNIFDESYRTILGQQMPGRNYMFTISITN